jgi:hypothetical protein
MACSLAYAFAVSLFALINDEMGFGRYASFRDQFRAIAGAIEEHVGYRQLTAWWRVRGMIDALRRSEHVWGHHERKGFRG